MTATSPADTDHDDWWRSDPALAAMIAKVEEERLIAQGFIRAGAHGQCGLCIARGERGSARYSRHEWIRRMPDSWEPERKTRYAHRYCVFVLIGEIARVTGQIVLP